jgi:hypothetical protein
MLSMSKPVMPVPPTTALKVHSSLQAFGMLAAVSARLAAACAYHFSWNINANKHSGFLQLHRQNASSVGGFISQS